MVHVPRERVLDDALASLTPDRRERIERSESRLVDFLDRRLRTTANGPVEAPLAPVEAIRPRPHRPADQPT
ncbi:hypothetical protein [Streptomyces sp. NPDC058872]|uniref:hypothetical protein n=1 Tax=Streptomyces sp. NPDC058872 TaxID=3346661 RepID=UPI00367FD705